MSLKKILNDLHKISKKDPRTSKERSIKLQEEVGEVSEAILRRHGCKSPRNKSISELNEDILEEVSDVIIVAVSIAERYDFTVEDLQDKLKEKLEKWEDNIKVIQSGRKRLMNSIIQLLQGIATIAHAGVSRKCVDEPYIVHPERVASLVNNYGGSDVMVAAAWGHDIKEDSLYYFELFQDKIPLEVKTLIEELSKPIGMNKKEWLRSLSKVSTEAIIIKLADRYDNLRDADLMNEGWLKKYLTETDIILLVAEEHWLEGHGLYKLLKSRREELR